MHLSEVPEQIMRTYLDSLPVSQNRSRSGLDLVIRPVVQIVIAAQSVDAVQQMRFAVVEIGEREDEGSPTIATASAGS